ncbi:MAG: pirin family protein [Sphingobacteriales bacterium]|nr:MAG: pirin family protein [Sphingobacteriales bacterium]TAF80494.1 MAG: pirin family protein [Sphingobacteriales bacterium]
MLKNSVLHKNNTRGGANHGWLIARHSFSFANYYNPDKMHFGALRVLNDDIIAAAKGFGMHPHNNMEIITIPLAGELEHKDSMGNTAVIKKGDIQILSAGSGIKHSEYNKSKDSEVQLLQIWVMPNCINITPSYDQISLNVADRYNNLQLIVSPNKTDEGVFIRQNAWFYLADFDTNFTQNYTLKSKGNGVYVFNLKGQLKVNDTLLDSRDGYGVWDVAEINLTAQSRTEFLMMEVPMAGF